MSDIAGVTDTTGVVDSAVDKALGSPRVVLFTCIYGDYDDVHEPVKQQNVNCSYKCFTDNPDLKSSMFETVVFEPRLLLDEERQSKISPVNHNVANMILIRTDLSLNPHLRGYDVCVYMDGNVQINDAHLLANMLASLQDASNRNRDVQLILTQHPFRTCVKDEIIESITQCPKYYNTDFDEQMRQYASQGYRDDNGLWWNGFKFYVQPFSPTMTAFYHLYSQEMLRWAKDPTLRYHPQGQVCLPYVLWKLDLPVITLPALSFVSPSVTIHWHRK